MHDLRIMTDYKNLQRQDFNLKTESSHEKADRFSNRLKLSKRRMLEDLYNSNDSHIEFFDAYCKKMRSLYK